MCFILNILEQILDRQIRDQFLQLTVLHDFQYTYQAGKSYELAIDEVVCSTQKALQDIGLVVVTFLYINETYDRCTFFAIKQVTIRHDIDETRIR